MRLYLSSYMWGNKPEKLFELVGNGPKHVGIITNSADQFPEEGIVQRLQDDISFLQENGFTAERLDLRDYFGKTGSELEEKIRSFGLIWVRGANVFVLRRAMHQSGFDALIIKFLKDDSVVYGGYSAGACVIGTTLRGLELADDAYIAPDRYDAEIIWEGLGMVPYAIAPHYKSEHPESADIDKAVEYFVKNGTPYRALHDGEAIVIDGDMEELLR